VGLLQTLRDERTNNFRQRQEAELAIAAMLKELIEQKGQGGGAVAA
jgi:hypothetical protein